MTHRDLLPQSVLLDRFDKEVIICVIAVFLILFVWLLWKNIQPPTYAFWTFTALLTLIFVGFLRATGVFRTTWGALGGSVAVYAGLLLLTQTTFERHYDFVQKIANKDIEIAKKDIEIANKNIEIDSVLARLKTIDPAGAALQQYFSFLRRKQFKEAYDFISDARKVERKRGLLPGADDFNQYVSTFDNTEDYRNLTYELVHEETENERRYRVAHDVLDNVPRNHLFENRPRSLSEFDGPLDRDRVIKTVIDNIREYYDVPESTIPTIQEYVKVRTLDDILDPTFLGEMAIYFENNKMELRENPNHPANTSIWRYFRYDNVVMIKQGAEWKIRSGLNAPVIALYKSGP